MIMQVVSQQLIIYRHFLTVLHSIFLSFQAINILYQLFTTFTHTRSLKGNEILLIFRDILPSFCLAVESLIKFQQKTRQKLRI